MDIFLPCREGSERVRKKNTRVFSNSGQSLLTIKLKQLLESNRFENVILSSDDPEVFNQAEMIASDRIVFDYRPKALATSETPLTELIQHAASLSNSDYLAWTHVTSPFFQTQDYISALEEFGKPDLNEEISLVSVHKHQNYFLFADGMPIDTESNIFNWPRTQDLKPIYEVDNALFIAPREIMLREGRRTTDNLKFFETDLLKSIDIDWETDFEIASRIWNCLFV
jgi:CMP-N-acetylneuraminic acid synthetase